MADKKASKANDKKKIDTKMIIGIVAIAIIIICVIVEICVNIGMNKNKPEEAKVAPIVGTWKYSGSLDYAYVFNADGTCSYVNPCTYKDYGDSVEILFDGNTDSQTLKYRIEGKTLYIEDSLGREVKYEKQ